MYFECVLWCCHMRLCTRAHTVCTMDTLCMQACAVMLCYEYAYARVSYESVICGPVYVRECCASVLWVSVCKRVCDPVIWLSGCEGMAWGCGLWVCVCDSMLCHCVESSPQHAHSIIIASWHTFHTNICTHDIVIGVSVAAVCRLMEPPGRFSLISAFINALL